MNQKELLEALACAADSDAANNEPMRDAYIEAELLRDAFVTLVANKISSPGMIVAGCSLLRKSGNGFFVILEFRDDEPLFDVKARNGTAGFGMPLDMLVGKVDDDGDLISLWVDRRRFEPVPEEVLRRQ